MVKQVKLKIAKIKEYLFFINGILLILKIMILFSRNAVCSFNDDFAELDFLKAEKFWQASYLNKD